MVLLSVSRVSIFHDKSRKKLSGSIVGRALETTGKQEERKTFNSFR